MEKRMINKIKRKDTKGLDYIMNTYSSNVYFLVNKIIGIYGKEEVEECVSDVFYKVWESINEFDEKRGDFSKFIYMKTKYLALDYKRRLEKNKLHNNLEKDLSNDISTEHIVLDKESSEEIIKVINSFREPDKTYFYLKYFMYYKTYDIAKKYKTTIASVENRLYKCRLQIKEMLEGRY